MLSVSPQPVENLGKVCENSRAGELICSRILPNVRLGFDQGYEGTENMFYLIQFNFNLIQSIFTALFNHK